MLSRFIVNRSILINRPIGRFHSGRPIKNGGGSLLDGKGDFSTDEYTDLRQAYTQTLIPVTMDDYNKIQKFNNVSEYKAHREKVNVTPLTEEESKRKLLQQKDTHDKHSAALAFKYAQESEKVLKKQQSFWGDIKQLSGW